MVNLVFVEPTNDRRMDSSLMKSNNLTLGEVLASPCQYVIPVFQRYYRWDQPQWDTLWKDLADLQAPERTGRHFMGFLVMVPETFMPGRINRSHLIDGQQRLTTLSLVLCALRDTARLAGCDELAMEIEVSALVHQFKKGDDRFRVFPKLRDREQYVACMNGETPTDGRLGAAVRYFSGRLTTIPEAGTEAGLRAFYDLLRQRLEFVDAQRDSSSTAGSCIFLASSDLTHQSCGVAPGAASRPGAATGACWTVGGKATPTAWNTLPQVPCASLRSRNRLPSCSTSTRCNRSRSRITSAHSRS